MGVAAQVPPRDGASRPDRVRLRRRRAGVCYLHRPLAGLQRPAQRASSTSRRAWQPAATRPTWSCHAHPGSPPCSSAGSSAPIRAPSASERQRSHAVSAQRASRRLAKLESEREKLLRAYYEDAITLVLLKKEQRRIDAEAAAAQKELAVDGQKLSKAKELVDVSLKLAATCEPSYRRAKPTMRRRYNQAFFEAIFVQGRRVAKTAYRAPFDALLAGSSKTLQVEPTGFEPVTFWLPARRSPS